MRIEEDFKEFIELLNKNSVRYLIVGGYAFAFHAEPRFTKDIDFFVEGSEENAERLLNALAGFGFKNIGLVKDDFIKSGDIVQLGVPPVRIDLMNSVSGLDFCTAWENRVTGSYGDIPAFFVSKADLIRNKMAVGRKQDLSDIDRLQKI
ncbi:MAG: nucleotidyl transferase AbiEii/AbiGii toxin family protein [Candidatus Aminicenantes bacterium]|nr:nucleotidyl transferase AbiEii/AbiGii toxin family protein [Candidatus Aminicenantes bacterium]